MRSPSWHGRSVQSLARVVPRVWARLRTLLPRTRALCFFEMTRENVEAPSYVILESHLPEGFRIEFPALGESGRHTSLASGEKYWRSFSRLQGEGAVLACVWDGNVLVHRSLAIRGPTKVPTFGLGVIQVPEGTSYIGHCETHHDYRGLGIYPTMLRVLASKLFHDDAVHSIILTADLENTASQRGATKAGFVLKRIAVGCTIFRTRLHVPLHVVCYDGHSFASREPAHSALLRGGCRQGLGRTDAGWEPS